jgi:gluconate 2-dehydrogenase gamma chain
MRIKSRRVTRRKFLEIGLSATAAGTLASCGRGGGGPYLRFFTSAEVATVDAICEQIIPADKDPGARQAGVVHFIDLQLTRHYRKHQEAYRKGIAGVESASRERFSKGFAELSGEQQIELLKQVGAKDAGFFTLIRTHTMQGFYGDPRHGGNRGEVSWKMLGVPNPPVRGRLPYGKKVG